MQQKIKFSGKKLSRYFGNRKKIIKAIDNIDFEIKEGEVVSVVGESACGKTVFATVRRSTAYLPQ